MARKYIDTNIFVRYWEGKEGLVNFFEKMEAGKKRCFLPSIVISEIVWVLGSYYDLEKTEIKEFVRSILNIRNLKVVYKHDLVLALELFEKFNIKFTDCVILSYMEKGDSLVSYDKEFDRIPWIKRLEPV
ncbi:PIN domain-containing protein [Patescibacteria group bacterium]|nr:PIN domain-containing protein [Patescibacteria group bacterium]